MTDIAAAIGRVQLTKLTRWTEQRRENASYYDRHVTSVTLPRTAPEAQHVFHQYTIRTLRRDEMQLELARAGVDAAVYYPVPVHRLPAYEVRLDLPETEKACREVLSLPIGPHLTQDELRHVTEVVNRWSQA